MKKDLKETLEFMKGVEELSKLMGKILADKEVSLLDLPDALLNLSIGMNVYSEAYKDADQIIDELKDLEQSEIILLVNSIYKCVYAFEKGRKGLV